MRRAQTAQHLVAAMLLLITGRDRVHHDALLGTLEIITGGVLVGSVVMEKFRGHHDGRAGIAWVELAGAVMTFLEAIEKTRHPHHFIFYVLSFIQPMVLLLFAIFDAQISARRFIKADDRGLEVRFRPFYPRRIAWDEMPSYRVLEDKNQFGDRAISVNDAVDRHEAKAWIVEKVRARGVKESAP